MTQFLTAEFLKSLIFVFAVGVVVPLSFIFFFAAFFGAKSFLNGLWKFLLAIYLLGLARVLIIVSF